jgi:hypothetical protein
MITDDKNLLHGAQLIALVPLDDGLARKMCHRMGDGTVAIRGLKNEVNLRLKGKDRGSAGSGM